uniref:Putative mitochondrial atp synthase coupling factor 6 n=1 Tax=Ixodes ricinus TaxID=34613 RepID=A0A6B0UP22_IXORI
MALNGKLHALATQCISHCRRNYGISAVLMQKSLDPVQKLFVDKLREYAQKSNLYYIQTGLNLLPHRSKSELFVDADEKIKMEYNDELKKAAVQFGGDKGSDMTKFPDFQFEDPQLDPINLEKK